MLWRVPLLRERHRAEPPLSPSDVWLLTPRPNPFRDRAQIGFELAREARVSLAVHDAVGRRVRTLLPLEAIPAGRFAVDWNDRNESGEHVASGVYFVHLVANGTRLAQRAVLIAGGK